MTLALCGFSVQGTVRAAPSGEPVAYAVIEAVDGTVHAESDSAGRYRLVCLAVTTHAIRISRMGFGPRTLEVAAAKGDTLHLDVQLAAQPLALSPIEVAGQPNRGQPPGPEGADDIGVPTERFSTRDLAQSPLVGNPDPLLSLPVPDALTAGDPLPGLHVRGGSATENLTLLDGVPIYNPYHAGGASALSPAVISSVTLYDDAAPAEWGGGLSSVVATHTRRAANESIGWDGSVDPLWAGQSFSSRILGGAGDILVGGRLRNTLLGPDQGRAASGADGLARLTAPTLGGTLELLLFGSEDRVGFDTAVSQTSLDQPPGTGDHITDSSGAAILGNRFRWATLTEALRWTGLAGRGVKVDVRGWRTSYDATIDWLGPAPLVAASGLRHVGVAVAVSGSVFASNATAGVDAQQFSTSYVVRGAGPLAPTQLLNETAAPVVVGAFLEDHWHRPGAPWDLDAGLRTDVAPWGAVGLEPRVTVGFAPTPAVAVTATYGESRQYLQSLTNEESIIGTMVGIALPVAADGRQMPIASADQATASLTLRPVAGTAVTVEGYLRRMDGLLLVAPVTALSFATSGAAVGAGRSSGALLSFEHRTPQVTIQGIYAVGTTILTTSGTSYTPAADPTQALAAGVAIRGPQGLSFRTALWGSFGRRTSIIADPIRWSPASELGDIGDLDGSPLNIRGPLDGAALPSYLRLDLGVRREWGSVLGHGARFAGVLTITNVLGRPNVAGVFEPVNALSAQALALTGRAVSVQVEWSPR